MPSPFVQIPGTNGFVVSPYDLQSTELNSLASGSASTSSVAGTSGVYSQTNSSGAIWGDIWFIAGGAVTPTAGGALVGWFLRSTNGGTTFESVTATPSATVMALPRSPDFTIPLSNSAYASGNVAFASGPVLLPFESFKAVIQNLGGAALPASGNHVTLGPVETGY